MTDLRQGVTPTQHDVLDLIDAQMGEWAKADLTFEDQIKAGRGLAADASRTSDLAAKRRYAIDAAARLIDAADEIGRLLEAFQ